MPEQAVTHDPGTIYNSIYQGNLWKHGSGAGSLYEHTAPYMAFLADFARQNHIRRMIDIGCGDWQSMQHFDLTGIDYTGFDVATVVVAQNTQHFANEHIRFKHVDAAGFSFPETELMVIKDVLQHWPTDRIYQFLPQLNKFKYALITNCVEPKSTLNSDIKDGQMRPLDLSKPPFNLPLKHVFTFTNKLKSEENFQLKWRKYVYLYDRDNTADLSFAVLP